MSSLGFVERLDLVPPVTRASMTEAWFAAQAEREQIYLETGVRIGPDGRIDLSSSRRPQ